MKRKLLTLGIVFMSMVSLGQTQLHWQCDISQYADYMSVVAVVKIDEVEQTTTTLEIGAFCGTVCRGSKLATMFPVTGRYIYQIPVYGSGGDMITFKLYDHIAGEELDVTSSVALSWQKDGYGRLATPYVIAFETPASWSDPEAWGGSVPGEGSNVTLPDDIIIDNNAQVTVASLDTDGNMLVVADGSALSVTGDLVNDNPDNLVLQDGAQIVNASPNVAAKAKKTITAYTAKDSNGWHLISSSVNDMPIAGSDFLTETYDLYRFNESTTTWENYRAGHADFTTFEKGRGYLYANSNGISPAFVGTLNNAAVTYQVTAAASTASSRGINIIGNPFPHNIYKGAGGAIDDSNLESGYYELTYSGAWVAHAFDDAIAPGQGVLVVAKSTGNVTIAKTNTEATAESASKSDVKRLKINVSGNGSEDRTYAYFSEGDGLDKLDNFSSSAAQISIKNGENDYAIAHVGEECEAMDVIFKNTKNADYTITIKGVEDFAYLHLIDKITGEDVDMLLEQSYTFHATGNEYAERFKVICRNNTGIGENAETAMFAYVNNGNIVVNGEGTLQLIDMTGRVINTVEINGTQMIEKPSYGVYVLRMISGNEVKTQKIVVK